MRNEVIYFLSDTHLGDGSGADRFLYPKQLMKVLHRVEAEPGAHLVLLGDIMELWASRLEGVLLAHSPIFETLARLSLTHPVTYVVGNHDCLPWYSFLERSFGNIRIEERYVGAGGGLIALHGHQFDPFNRVQVRDGGVKVPWIQWVVRLMGFLGRVGGDRTGEALATAGERFTEAIGTLEQMIPQVDEGQRVTLTKIIAQTREVLSKQSPGERGYPLGERIYEDAAAGLMEQGARWVVMGHTHHPLRLQLSRGVYVNTGCWVWDRYPPTYARYANGRLDLLDADTGAPFQA